jgi:hypothetical protein
MASHNNPQQTKNNLKQLKRYLKRHSAEIAVALSFTLFIIGIFWYQFLSATSTFFITLLTGVLIFLIGQLAMRLIIEPILEVRRTIGRITYALKYYANVYDTDIATLDHTDLIEAINETRKLACELEANYNAVFFKTLPSWILPERSNISNASSKLIFVSNNIGYHGEKITSKVVKNYHVISDIKKQLKITSID